ncbi:MAG TPA: phosphoribosylamine--glycine ligase [Phycisphaerales bacterium]|nr:phosphoribosylamine--glycine ligase [Phycisphaerales bacterium]
MTTDGKVNVLLVGSGGREHALAWKMARSPRMGRLWLTDSSNPGLNALGRVVDVPVDIKQIYRLRSFCEKNAIGLVVIGPEEPLAQGYADALITPGRVVFGPVQAASRLEADKAWCKQLMRAASIPTGEGRIFSDPEGARAYVESRVHDEDALKALYEEASKYRDPADRRTFIRRKIEADKTMAAAYRKRHDDLPVIKAAGLAKGKGVFLPTTLLEAMDVIERIMVRKEFGEAGKTVVIEERLEGREVSVLALTDGRSIYMLETCQDHKRLGDGDTGPNTGGMGVICPSGLSGGGHEKDEELLKQIESEILVPTLDALRRDGIDYRGVLYAGIMLTPAGPKVLEYNCRFGDPECQALMVRLESDLIDLLMAVGQRTLDEAEVRWSQGEGAQAAASCCVVLAAENYPAKPVAGAVITGIEKAEAMEGVRVFYAGVKKNEKGEIVTAGGRVLNVVGVGETLAQARARAYEAASVIRFKGKQMRTDIGAASEAVHH